MRTQHYIIVLLSYLMTLAFIACTQDELVSRQTVGEGNFALSLTCSNPTSRANTYIEDGIPEWNENKIVRLDCFFYKNSDGMDAPASHYMSFDNLQAEGQTTVKASLSTGEISKLAGAGNSFKVYVVANLPENNWKAINKVSSINQLKQLPLTASFNPKGSAAIKAQSSFVMDSKDAVTVTYDKAKNSVSGKVDLYRVAAKIMLNITGVIDVIQKDGIIWHANKENMYVELRHGISSSKLDPVKYPTNVTDANRFNTDPFQYKKVTKEVDGTSTELYQHELPFYSYANDWNTVEKQETFLILVVNWKNDINAQTGRNCYYQIPVNIDGKKLERNSFYKINLTVSTLGSFEPIEPTLVKPSYVIMDWGTQEIKATLQNFRYLMVSPTKYVMNNKNTLVIPYASSHNIKMEAISYTQPNLTENIATIDDITKELPEHVHINPTDHTITYDRTLDNKYTSIHFDFTPYTIKFKVSHVDKPEFNEVIEIIQYPAIYAEANMNSDYKIDGYKNGNHGYVFVNGYYSKNSENHQNQDNSQKKPTFLGSAAGLHGFNTEDISPNMYVFTVTSVEGTDYIIGDPRVKTPDNLQDVTWAKSPCMESTANRQLTNYYPTDGSDATKNVIAPRFRIASTYGGFYYTETSTSATLEGIKKRCASYQEDGYPAGRWRLPTQAEFKFILYMVNKKKIPPIYVTDSPYWCAHGLGKYNGTDVDILTEQQKQSVRCVYDEWYWNDKCDKTKFTWGDRPR